MGGAKFKVGGGGGVRGGGGWGAENLAELRSTGGVGKRMISAKKCCTTWIFATKYIFYSRVIF